MEINPMLYITQSSPAAGLKDFGRRTASALAALQRRKSLSSLLLGFAQLVARIEINRHVADMLTAPHYAVVTLVGGAAFIA